MRSSWIPRAELLAIAMLVASCAREPAPKRAEPPPAPESHAPAKPEFLAPQPGQVLTEGQSFVLRWQAPGWRRVNVGAVMGGKDRGHLAFGRDATIDTLVWQIPVGWVTGFGIASADNVRLRLENADDPSQFVDSAPFTVKGEKP